MKVMMVTIDFPPCYVGGEGIFSGVIADLLHSKGIELEVVAPDCADASQYDSGKGYQIHRVPMIGKTFVTKMPSFGYHAAKIVNAYDGDLFYLLRPCFPLPKRYIAHFHTTRYGEATGCFSGKKFMAGIVNSLFIPLDRYLSNNATSIIVLSKGMGNYIRRFSCKVSDKLSIIGNGVDLNTFRSHKQERRNYKSRILFVGRLDHQKGIFDLLHALIIARRTCTNMELTIVGSGPLETEILTFLKTNGLDKITCMKGRVDQDTLVGIYNEHDLVVLPSYYESFGLVILEAMACGTPVITTNICADLGQPTFRPHDVQGLANMMNSLIGDASMLQRLSEEGISTASRYGWEHIVDQLIGHFVNVLQQRRGSTK